MVQDHSAAVLRRQLGRPAAPSARQFRGFLASRVEAEMAGSPWHRTLDAFLHRLRTRTAAQVLRSCPARQGHRLVKAAQGALAGAPYRRIRTTLRKGMA